VVKKSFSGHIMSQICPSQIAGHFGKQLNSPFHFLKHLVSLFFDKYPAGITGNF
jgi:hypothetical protein